MRSYRVLWHRVGGAQQSHVTKILNTTMNPAQIRMRWMDHIDRVIDDIQEINEVSTKKRKKVKK